MPHRRKKTLQHGRITDCVSNPQINHNQRYAKPAILEALFKVTGNADFYPVAYRPSKIGDLFLLRNCPGALQKLIQSKLKLLMADGQEITLTLKLEVAPFQTGQIQVRNKLAQVLQKRRRSLRTVDHLPNVLDLSSLATEGVLAECVIDFGSNSAAAMLNMSIRTNDHGLLNAPLRGISLSNNNLSRLQSFRQWPKVFLHLLDLSNNNVSVQPGGMEYWSVC